MVLDYSSDVGTSLPLRILFDCKQDSSQSTYTNVFISYEQNMMVGSFSEKGVTITKPGCIGLTRVKRTAALLNLFNWQSGFNWAGC